MGSPWGAPSTKIVSCADGLSAQEFARVRRWEGLLGQTVGRIRRLRRRMRRAHRASKCGQHSSAKGLRRMPQTRAHFPEGPGAHHCCEGFGHRKKLQLLRTAKAPPQLDFQISNELIDPTDADWIRFIIGMRIRHKYVVLECLDV